MQHYRYLIFILPPCYFW